MKRMVKKSNEKRDRQRAQMARLLKLRWMLVALVQVACLSSPIEVANGQSLPTREQFGAALKVCAGSHAITLDPSVISYVDRLYAEQGATGSLRSSSDFLQSVSEKDRLEAYRLYVDCITKILSGSSIVTPAPVTVTYRVCSGEYERACQPHDAYLYCYSDVGGWAGARCESYKIQRLNTYGGNKCGYSLDAVICTGPK
jgi:hypothetical protein